MRAGILLYVCVCAKGDCGRPKSVEGGGGELSTSAKSEWLTALLEHPN